MSENRLVVFGVGDMRIGLPISRVEKVVFACEVSPLPNAPEIVLGVVNIHGTIVPVFDMSSRLGWPPRGIHTDSYFVICNTPPRKVALLIYELLDVTSYDPAAVVASEQILPGLEHVDGIVRLADGMIIVQDMDRFLSIDEENALQTAMAKHIPE